MAANSARMRQSTQPERVMKTVIGIEEAPSAVTMTGAIPVTKIVPARPMTKAPHQPVSRLSPAEAYFSSWEAVVCLGSAMTSPLTRSTLLACALSPNYTIRKESFLPVQHVCVYALLLGNTL